MAPTMDAPVSEEKSSWMEKHWDLLSRKPLYRVCFPGSHDSGTFVSTYETEFGKPRVTRTQLFDIRTQLAQGVRSFDLRPILYAGEFYTAHYSELPRIGRQGAIGVELKAALHQVHAFVSVHRKELVILRFSHVELAAVERELLFELVRTSLQGVLICGDESDLCEATMSDLIARGNVIAVFDTEVAQGSSDGGIWGAEAVKARGGYSNTDKVPLMISSTRDGHPGQLNQLQGSRRGPGADRFLFELCWQLTLQGVQNGPTGTQSILDLAADANAALFGNVNGWLEDGTINQEVYPNVINTDACEESTTRAVELSISINRMLTV